MKVVEERNGIFMVGRDCVYHSQVWVKFPSNTIKQNNKKNRIAFGVIFLELEIYSQINYFLGGNI